MQDRMPNVTRVTLSPTSETLLRPFNMSFSINRAALTEREREDIVEMWNKEIERR